MTNEFSSAVHLALQELIEAMKHHEERLLYLDAKPYRTPKEQEELDPTYCHNGEEDDYDY